MSGIRFSAVVLAAGSVLAVQPVRAATDGEVPVGTAAAAVSELHAGDILEDYGDLELEEAREAPPRVTFGRAVDLLGRDIAPQPKGGAVMAGGLPSGLPLSGARLTSGFGNRYHPVLGGTRFHAGLDMAAPTGTPVTATGAGRISRAGWAGGYGILVSIEHGGARETRYAHLSAIAVRPGEMVRQGQVIGYVGSTGRSTGPHLHYETRVAGQAVDPWGSR